MFKILKKDGDKIRNTNSQTNNERAKLLVLKVLYPTSVSIWIIPLCYYLFLKSHICFSSTNTIVKDSSQLQTEFQAPQRVLMPPIGTLSVVSLLSFLLFLRFLRLQLIPKELLIFRCTIQ